MRFTESKIEKIKGYLISIYKTHFNYELIKLNLMAYPDDTIIIIEAIIKVLKKIRFRKIFTIKNILTLISKLLDKIILFLLYIKHYDILNGVEYCLFHLRYYIDRYIRGQNEFFFIYKCRYEPGYYGLCLKHFLKLKLRTGRSALPVTLFIVMTFMTLFYIPLFWVVIGDIEKFNTLDNILHYWHSNLAPL
ncbi:hypothetical protein BcabD6B2_58960 (apicoplast) [Babesia caballi]|uniref:Uncharacterized protein n=1 Tax=Babesia caballi TaxID=5871 RepID=A0AAV4M272_BABCB|nr:hypothetical protein BcabD6B2_58960 [Babesia caballi]